jgi:hypothetical protein
MLARAGRDREECLERSGGQGVPFTVGVLMLYWRMAIEGDSNPTGKVVSRDRFAARIHFKQDLEMRHGFDGVFAKCEKGLVVLHERLLESVNHFPQREWHGLRPSTGAEYQETAYRGGDEAQAARAANDAILRRSLRVYGIMQGGDPAWNRLENPCEIVAKPGG